MKTMTVKYVVSTDLAGLDWNVQCVYNTLTIPIQPMEEVAKQIAEKYCNNMTSARHSDRFTVAIFDGESHTFDFITQMCFKPIIEEE